MNDAMRTSVTMSEHPVTAVTADYVEIDLGPGAGGGLYRVPRYEVTTREVRVGDRLRHFRGQFTVVPRVPA
jgi:hypothetical protein